MTKGLSIRGYAAHRKKRGLPGATAGAVHKAIQDGVISRNANGKIDPDKSDKDWARNQSGTMEPGETTKPQSYAQARAERERYNAKLARLKYEREKGTLVDAAEVKKAAFESARIVRDRLLMIPDRISAEIAAMSDARKIETLLENEIRSALKELCGDDT